MKRIILFFIFCFPFLLTAQLISDDFESYNVGDFDSQWTAGEWVGWFNNPSLTTISDEQANGGTKSLKVELNHDVVALLGTLDQGAYEISYYEYVPTGNAAYTNLQHNYTATTGDWLVEMYVNQDGTGSFTSNGSAFPFTPVYDQWAEYKFELNFITSEGTFSYNGNPLFIFAINTNANGSTPALNQVNAINFFGGCINQTACTPTAYYDDVSVVEIPIPPYDARIINPSAPSEYTSVPVGLEQPVTLQADVLNVGSDNITDVTVTFTLKDSGGSTLMTETSDPVASIASTEIATISTTTTYTLSGVDNYVMEYEVNITETDGNMADNMTTLDVPYIFDPSVYSRDNGGFVDGIGINGATGILGQTFEFIDQAIVTDIAIFYAGGAVNDTIKGYIYEADAASGEPATLVAEAVPHAITEVGGVGSEIFVLLNFTDEVELPAGDYIFLVEQAGINNLLLSASTTIYTPGRTWASTDDGATWSNLEAFNIPVALGVRPLISMVGVNTDESAANYINDLTISPNPTSDFVTIDLQLNEVKDFTLEIFNVNGQRIQTFDYEKTFGGQYQLNLTLNR